jgi:hypothetical protein
MAFYQIEWKRSAQKELHKPLAATIRKILDAVEHLPEQLSAWREKIGRHRTNIPYSHWRLSGLHAFELRI